MDPYGTYDHEKILGKGNNKLFIPPLTNYQILISQRVLFKMCMKSNMCAIMLSLFNVYPFTKVWCVLDNNNNLIHNLGEFLKLAKMAMVHILGS